MPTTTGILVEQVMRRLAGGDPSASLRVHKLEVRKAIEQMVNALLRPQYLNTLAAGENIPEGCVLTTYDAVPVESWKGVSKSKLPAIPVALPRNMGVFRISKTDDVMAYAFIPMAMGQMGQVKSQRLISDLLGQIGYEVRGGEVIYTKDLPAGSPAATSVRMELVVMDFSKYGDYDIIPLDASMEAEVVDTVYKMFAPVPVVPNVVDPTNDSR